MRVRLLNIQIQVFTRRLVRARVKIQMEHHPGKMQIQECHREAQTQACSTKETCVSTIGSSRNPGRLVRARGFVIDLVHHVLPEGTNRNQISDSPKKIQKYDAEVDLKRNDHCIQGQISMKFHQAEKILSGTTSCIQDQTLEKESKKALTTKTTTTKRPCLRGHA